MSGTTLFLLSVILITIAYFFFRTGQNARQQAGDREEKETAEGIAPPDGEKQIAVSPVPHGVYESPEEIQAARVAGEGRPITPQAGAEHAAATPMLQPVAATKEQPAPQPPTSAAADETKDLQRVKQGGYQPIPLMNKTEKQAFFAIQSYIKEHKLQHELFCRCQVSLGSILSHENQDAYGVINCKRVDFLLTDKDDLPLLVIEIFGPGHFPQNAAGRKDTEQRDAMKRHALQSAGVGYLVVDVQEKYAAGQWASITRQKTGDALRDWFAHREHRR